MNENWKSYELGNIVSIYNGSTPSTTNEEFWNGDIIWVTPKDLSDQNQKYISEGERKITRKALSKTKLLPKGTVLLSSRAPIGLLSISITELVTNQGFKNIVVDEKLLNNEFLYYNLKLRKNELNNLGTGTTFKELSKSTLEKFKINLPDLPTQRSIAKVLSDLDAKIELNNKINQELEAMAKTLYDYWFVQFDFPTPPSSTSGIVGKPYKSSGGKMVYNEELKREIPEGWEVGTVEDYCRIFTGKKDVNQSLEIGKYKFFSCAPGYKYSDEKLYEGKAILVSGNGSYTGRTIFVDEGFDLYQRTYACVNKTETDYLAYIYYSMLRYMSLKINGGTHGSAIPYIVFDDIAKEIIVINHNLINKFQNIVYPLINKIMNNNKQAVELAKLRDWLLPMLMNGQVASRASATAK